MTSKAVSKVEGRLILLDSADEDAREAARQAAIDAETVRLVAQRGDLRIVETRHGLVLAAAGVDLSNVARNEIALLPVDPDASAQLLREGLRERLGVEVGVVISDSMGRPWRAGITDTAIGVAGVTAVTDARGRTDALRQRPRTSPRSRSRTSSPPPATWSRASSAACPVAIVRGLRRATGSSTTTASAAAR